MKIFTIGDSISQGFMSGAAARTDLAYSTIIARILGVNEYHFPTWGKDGLPLNLEAIFRRLEKRLGSDIKGLLEWPRALNIINHYLDEVEDYYERGEGSIAAFLGNKPFHNVSVRGFDLAYSWLINPQLCRDMIQRNSKKNKDNWWGMVNESLLRTAHKVLKTGTNDKLQNPSQLDWLRHHHQKEGVENLILWLGANNALGTVLDLQIRQTSFDGSAFAKGPQNVSFEERENKKWNLWHPEDFRVEYQYMLNQVMEIMQNNPHQTDYKVFVGTVPLVTIAPLIKAAGNAQDRESIKVTEWRVDQANPAPMGRKELGKAQEETYLYGKHYPYFVFADTFHIKLPHLNLIQALHIDNTIRKYNQIIQELIADANEKLGAKRFYLVDIGSVLSDMALKRNAYMPPYKYPNFFDYVYPKIDTRYYGTTREGDIMSGGLFSLDGVHPTAIGQGLIAYEFLKVMKKAKVFTGNPETAIDWKSIFNSDTLYSDPIGLMSELYDNIELKEWILLQIRKMK
jgi:hypothetical protein